ncbi:MAG: ethylbenzene dehydrogenase-related protein [Anaerolineaceae bacterium]
MRKPFFLLALSASAAALLIAACGGDSTTDPTQTTAATSAPTKAPEPTIAAAPTDVIALKKSPTSLAGDDAVWKDARVTTVKTTVIKGSEAKGPVDVKMQALNSDTDVWFRFEWAAAQKTTARDWTFDGTKFKAPSGQQDRLALFWEIKPSTDFQAKGCAALCHNPETDKIDKWWMVSPPGSLMDNWQWTAGISNGMNQANDLTLSDIVPAPTALGVPFVADPNTGGGNTANTNDAKDAPKMMQDPAKKPSLGTDYLLVSEAIALDVTKLKAGDKIPNALLEPFKGSRGDVEAKGVWANGTWTVVFHRKLDTGNVDDAKFAPGGSYKFGLGAFVALGDVDHTITTDPYTLKLAK